ncbi:MAG: hypothetical protein RL430_2108 [Actinomycetota bacterium]
MSDIARTLSVETHTLPPSTILGFRAGWISGDGNGVSFELDSTAGFGGSTLSLTVKFEDGARVTETIDMREVMPAWVDAIVAEHREEKP